MSANEDGVRITSSPSIESRGPASGPAVRIVNHVLLEATHLDLWGTAGLWIQEATSLQV